MGLFGDILSLPVDVTKDVVSGFGVMEGEINSSTLNRLDKIADNGRTKRHNEKLAVELACAAIKNRSNSINNITIHQKKESISKKEFIDYINMNWIEAKQLAEETEDFRILRKLSRHNNWMVRCAVVKNFETEDRLLIRMYNNDNCPHIVREAEEELENRGYEFEE